MQRYNPKTNLSFKNLDGFLFKAAQNSQILSNSHKPIADIRGNIFIIMDSLLSVQINQILVDIVDY